MVRHFNTAGPCRPEIHYTLPTMGRLPEVRTLVESQSYFVLHAPRQVGKTTALLSFAETLTAEGRFAAVLASVETASVFEDVGAAELAVLGALRGSAEVRLPAALWPPPWPQAAPGGRIWAALRAWAEASPRPLVLFLDEIDALAGPALMSVLRQLRDGHTQRPRSFPWSLALIGMRDVRDYRVASGGANRARSASPFNFKSDSLTLRAFTADEVRSLYALHTAETGQRFDDAAVTRAFELTRGQPWLVNALARQCVEAVVTDRARPITAPDIDRARERLIQRQDTHLDSLAERLREPRVRRVIGPMLAGGALGDVSDDDRRYVIDLGLVRRSDEGGLDVANPIYREVIVRSLAQGIQDGLPQIKATWLSPDGALAPERLLAAFLDFWREHGEAMLGSAPYAEVAAQLVLMAFLHRVVNGGGTVAREYAIGRGRIDLCVTLGAARLAMELKAWRSGQRDPAPKGLAQLDAYLDGLGLATGWLVVFDQRKRRPPPSRRVRAVKAKTPSGRGVTVVRL